MLATATKQNGIDQVTFGAWLRHRVQTAAASFHRDQGFEFDFQEIQNGILVLVPPSASATFGIVQNGHGIGAKWMKLLEKFRAMNANASSAFHLRHAASIKLVQASLRLLQK